MAPGPFPFWTGVGGAGGPPARDGPGPGGVKEPGGVVEESDTMMGGMASPSRAVSNSGVLRTLGLGFWNNLLETELKILKQMLLIN